MDGLTLLALCNIAGDIAFCTGGVLNGRNGGVKQHIWALSGLATTFFGGAFLRDILTLHKMPAILGSPHEIIAVALFAVILTIMFAYSKSRIENMNSKIPQLSWILKKGIVLLDSLGILAFAVIGVDKAIEVDSTYIITVACGFYTACGGGIIAALIRHTSVKPKLKEKWQHFKNTFVRNIPYYYFGLAIAITYSLSVIIGVEKNFAVALITPIAIVVGFLTDYEIQHGQDRG
ncbi:hypothetical protein FACS189499_05740 [Clostridia bacterium]|nr:hypothetical protein FACS189499_05740 [Clostridia bacterium]